MEEHLVGIIAFRDRTIHELRLSRASDMIRLAEVMFDAVECVAAPPVASPDTQARATEVADASGAASAEAGAEDSAQASAEVSAEGGADGTAEAASAYALTQTAYKQFLAGSNATPRSTWRCPAPSGELVFPSGNRYVWDKFVVPYGGWVPVATRRRIQ